MRHWQPYPGSLCLLASLDQLGAASAHAAEQTLLAIPNAARRQQAIAVRELARVAMQQLGCESAHGIGRSENGAPIWPSGWTGSLAHDSARAVALLARSGEYAALGVDVEPLQALPEDAASLVISGHERQHIASLPGGYARWSRALFGAKECVHKLLNPLSGVFLDFDEVAIEFDAGSQLSVPSFRVMPLSDAASDVAHIRGRVWFTEASVVSAAAIRAGAI
jgi:4'-phosphopantetheinyl transferase EntD